MNARQRRKDKRKVWGDHFRWPLGTRVVIQTGHHSPAAVGLVGRVNKHGYPCTHKVNCIVVFDQPVVDVEFCNTARYSHYVKFSNLRRV